MEKLNVSQPVHLGAGGGHVQYEGLVEGDEAREAARIQSLMDLERHAEDLGFYSEGTREPWRGFEQRRGRVNFEY